MSSPIHLSSSDSDASAPTVPASTSVPLRASARKKRLGGGLSLLGGSGTGAAFFLLWFILVLAPAGCQTVPNVRRTTTITGWELFGEQPGALVLLLPVLLAAGVNIGIGLIRLVAPYWKAVLSRFALYWTVAALAAFFPWISNMPLPPPSTNPQVPVIIVVDAHPQPGVFAAFAGLLVALAGTLLQQERLPTQQPYSTMPECPKRARRGQWFISALVFVSMLLALIFLAILVNLSLDAEALHDGLWMLRLYLFAPPILLLLALTCWLYAMKRPALLWRAAMLIPVMLSGSMYLWSWRASIGSYATSIPYLVVNLILLTLAYLLSALLCYGYADFVLARRAPAEPATSPGKGHSTPTGA